MLVSTFASIWGLLALVESLSEVAKDDLNAFVHQAQEAMTQRFNSLERKLHKDGIRQLPGTPAWFMGASHAGKYSTKNITSSALMAEEATKYIAHALGVRGVQLTGITVIGTDLGKDCPAHEEPWCRARKYRSLSGHCNNVQSPSWGSSGTAYSRYLPPDYADYISLPRGTALYSAAPRNMPTGSPTN